jgi:magnesium transporter
VGGNAGNQTLALVIRAYALDQISETSFRRLLRKELAVGGVNGLVWGGVMALVTLLLYQSLTLAGVMLAAMVITLTCAAVAGVLTPTLLRRFGQDPAYGSAIVLTGITDSLGFLVFLGLAALLLG